MIPRRASWISLAVALFLALLLGGILFTGRVSAQAYGHMPGFNRHGMMGYPMGATAIVTDTTEYGYPHYGWGMYGMMGHEGDDMPCFHMAGAWGMHNMMGGMWTVAPTGEEAVGSVEEARLLAEEYATTRLIGATLGEPIASRPGGYRYAVLRDGEITGVISVNAHSGEVWYHAWQ